MKKSTITRIDAYIQFLCVVTQFCLFMFATKTPNGIRMIGVIFGLVALAVGVSEWATANWQQADEKLNELK